MTDRRIAQLVPVMAVVVLVAVGLVVLSTGHWVRGSAVLGGAAGVGALLRLLLPERSIGPLRVRGRVFDVLFLGALALLFVLASLITVA